MARTYKWTMTYLKGLHLTIDRWREGRNKDLYKTKSKPRFHLKVWEWDHENYLEDMELEMLSLDKDETDLE